MEITHEQWLNAQKRFEAIQQKALERVNEKAAANPEIDIEAEMDNEFAKAFFEENESSMLRVVKDYAQSLTEHAEGLKLSELKSLTDFIARKSTENPEAITPTAADIIQNLNELTSTLSDLSEKAENEATGSKIDHETAQQAAEMLAEMNRKSMVALNERLNLVIKAYQEHTEAILNQYLKDNAEGEEVPAELLTAFIEALMEAENEEEPAAIYAAKHYLEKDQSGNLTPEAIEAAEIFKSAYEKAAKSISNHENKAVSKDITAVSKDIKKVIADNWVKIHQNKVTNELSFIKPKFDLKPRNGLFKSQINGNSDLMIATEQMIRNGGDITQFDTTARIFLEYAFEQFYNYGGNISFSFSIDEYAKRCQITPKQVYERLTNLQKTFDNIKISFPGVKGFIRILNILYHESYVHVSFSAEFHEYISSQKQYSMYASTYMQTINIKFNPHTYYILKKLSFDKHMQVIGKQKSGNHSISKLLECAIELPNESAVNRKYKEKITKPFIRDLEKLVTDGIIKIKLYNNSEEITLENAQKLKFSEFKALTYNCELVNYPKKIEEK